jgi:hypothetical protein
MTTGTMTARRTTARRTTSDHRLRAEAHGLEGSTAARKSERLCIDLAPVRPSGEHRGEGSGEDLPQQVNGQR